MPMNKTFTENDLIQFLYGELNHQQTFELHNALSEQPELEARLDELSTTLNLLDGVTRSPSARTVQNILDYSRGQAVQTA